jgi:hypothetical protein
MAANTCAVSLCNVGYEAITNYRNRYPDQDGQVGRCRRYTAEPLYLGLTILGTVETTARLVVAVVIKSVWFVACWIPSDFADQYILGPLDSSFVWIRDSVQTCATATAASTLSLKNNLTHGDQINAERQTVEKFARKHFVSNWVFVPGAGGPGGGAPNALDPAKPFSFKLLKIVTNWRNNFLNDRGEPVTSTKIFKKIVAVPLYLGVAAAGLVESVARTAYVVGVYMLLIKAMELVIEGLVIGMAVPMGYALGAVLTALSAITPPAAFGVVAGITVSFALMGTFSLLYFSMICFGMRMAAGGANSHATWLLQHLIGAMFGAVYPICITATAALVSLKDNLMNNSNRVSALGLVDFKKQMQFMLTAGFYTLIGLGGAAFCAYMAVVFTIIRLFAEPFGAFFNTMSIPMFWTTLRNNLYQTGVDAIHYGSIGFNIADQASQEVADFIGEALTPSTYA